MTPELKTACEVIFQQHKLSSQIKWNRDVFRGQISLGISELAKETLMRKKIIVLPDKSKRIITLLNPAVANAANFEEAEEMIEKNIQPAFIKEKAAMPAHTVNKIPALIKSPAENPKIARAFAYTDSKAPAPGIKWYMKPVFYYVVWPLCAVIAGALISFLIDFTYTKLFLELK